ncbi:protein serine/threonine kinase, putative [Entamoeba invadens IP1]|uniref:Protein serine/threonine kinase, putative n=1 Tax=Entamoeba invadens IP1 TaxID=370355 RepID=A0A0A1U0S4_ENTIV|nr:protein serine/threonine kinase, putative [Entamoeba invadens IP1]ELP87477.1 protein serine/threonine kinase, putative [Entamoeba invadens IP1]|eukprot:XP_004254248.1 protein serine/threonine kinase, putative [Entamoeba invadens IP1]
MGFVLSVLVAFVLQSSAEKWCFTENSAVLSYRNELSKGECDYSLNRWIGILIDTTTIPDIISVYPDCCSYEMNSSMNQLFIDSSTYPVAQKHVLQTSFYGTNYTRNYFNITLFETNKQSAWTIYTANIISGSLIYLSGIALDSHYSFFIESRMFNITTNSNSQITIDLTFSWGFSPVVFVDENTEVLVLTESDRSNCQYRYTTKNSIKSSTVDNENLEMRNLCTTSGYQRMFVCNKKVPISEDCTCSYYDHEYINHAQDCTVMSKYLTFVPLHIQEETPYQFEWNTLEISGETTMTIKKGSNMTFLSPVYLPNDNLIIDGMVIFKGGIVVNDFNRFYSFSSFQIENVTTLQRSQSTTPILFNGKCSMGESKCEEFYNKSAIKEVKCGGPIYRYISNTSDLRCECYLLNSTHFKQADCAFLASRRQYNFDLVLDKDLEKDGEAFYFNSIRTTTDSVILKSDSIVVQTVCDFTKSTYVEIKTQLECGKVLLSNTTRVVGTSGFLKTYNVQIIGVVNNLNGNALISMGNANFISDGGLKKTFESAQNTCFELATSKTDISSSLNNAIDSGFVSYVLSNKLVRVCPVTTHSTNDLVVVCEVGSVFGNFEYEQCPCVGIDCLFRFNSNTIEIQNENEIINGTVIFPNLTPLNNVVQITKMNIIETLKFTLDVELLLSGPKQIDIKINTEHDVIIKTPNDITIKGVGKNLGIVSTSHFIDLVGTFSQINLGGPNNTMFSLSVFPKSLFTSSKINRISQIDSDDLHKFVLSDKNRCVAGHFVNNLFVCDSCGNGEINGTCKPLQTTSKCSHYGPTGICVECVEGYFVVFETTNSKQVSKCFQCPSNCRRCDNNICFSCFTNYSLYENKCVLLETTCLFFRNEMCLKCSIRDTNVRTISNTNTSTYSNGLCQACDTENCISCPQNKVKCEICSKGYVLQDNECVFITPSLETTTKGVTSCIDTFFVSSGKCISCNELTQNCKLCSRKNCYTCSSGFSLVNGKCVNINSTACGVIKASKCMKCKDGFSNQPYCTQCDQFCETCSGTSSSCTSCKPNSSIWLENGICMLYQTNSNLVQTVTTLNTSSLTLNLNIFCENNQKGICVRCRDGYYLTTSGTCEKCNKNCFTCMTSSTKCLSCAYSNMSVVNDKCILNEQFLTSCTVPMVSNKGCAVCANGYYRNSTVCVQCPFPMVYCSSSFEALSCSNNYILYNKKCIAIDMILNCFNKNENGCTRCHPYYFLVSPFCISCPKNCMKCSSTTCCNICENNTILVDGLCFNITSQQHCTSAYNNKCISCERGYHLSHDICETKSLWWISLVVIISIFFVILVIVLYFLLTFISKKVLKVKQENTIDFKSLNLDTFDQPIPGIFIDALSLKPTEEVNVKETRKYTICVANSNKHKVKIQVTQVASKKWDLKITPDMVFLRKNQAVNLCLEITPFCSTCIAHHILFSVISISTNESKEFTITTNIPVKKSNYLDPDDIKLHKKIGSGAFGDVFIGLFQKVQVAVKKMRVGRDVRIERCDDFNKEIEMLDKIRSDYIIHFYGAVLGDEKEIVLEYAKCGSLEKLIHKLDKPVVLKLRVKFMLDAAKGILYLHNNGILHRDIKPGNFLVVTMDNNVPVNIKLTDFGSSKSINMLMTNMTFTCGIGTPIYMAPEILFKRKYKTPADIYSFAITMYSVMNWEEPYRKENFKYPWDVARFVTTGGRLAQTAKTPNYIFQLITNCWAENPQDRVDMNTVVTHLETYFSTL